MVRVIFLNCHQKLNLEMLNLHAKRKSGKYNFVTNNSWGDIRKCFFLTVILINMQMREKENEITI